MILARTLALTTLSVSLVVFADEQPIPANQPDAPAEQTQSKKVERFSSQGGAVEKPGAMKGKVAIIDTQARADIKSYMLDTIAYFDHAVRYNIVYETADPADVETLKKASGADFVVVVLSDDSSPAILVAPEDRWAVVNVTKLTRGFKSVEARKKLYDERCAKATLKAFSLLCGGGASKYPNSVFGTARMEDLDIAHGKVPVDMADRYRAFLSSAGLSPRVVTSYRRACIEGWAPAPTNEVQQAIWDKEHQIPSSPIKIKRGSN